MDMLQIALALAVSMLIFSTLASMVVEIIHKVLRLRHNGLKKMLTTFYMTEVKQKMQGLVAGNNVSSEEMPDFIKKASSMTGGSHTLSTIEFIRCFAETEIGKSLAERADNEIDTLIDNITKRYEDYGRQASEIFRLKSQILTVIVSISMAFLLNINVVTLFNTFKSNEELTNKFANQAGQVLVDYQVHVELLKKTINMDNSLDVKDIQEDQNKFKEVLEEIKQSGIPIGWSDDDILNPVDLPENMNEYVWWVSFILTGILIGLGGPFWFDLVKRLSVVRQVAGALSRQPPEKNEISSGTAPQKASTAAITDNPKTAFKNAIRAQHIMDGSRAEAGSLLGPRGMRL